MLIRHVKYHVGALHRHMEGPASTYFVEGKERRTVAPNQRTHENSVPVNVVGATSTLPQSTSLGTSSFCFN